LINGSIGGGLKSATEVAATDAKTTRGASRSKAEGLRGLQASRRRSTSQYVGPVSTADLAGVRSPACKKIKCRGDSHAAGTRNIDCGDVDGDD
jgi:hypothetical protein